jgi:hypothetical protein
MPLSALLLFEFLMTDEFSNAPGEFHSDHSPASANISLEPPIEPIREQNTRSAPYRGATIGEKKDLKS